MLIKPITVKNVLTENNVFLAPLSGISDAGFRKVCRIAGAGLSCTEMVSAKGLYYKNKGTQKLLFADSIEKPAAVQIFGNCPEIMAEACKNPLLSGFDIIDINMGCPVPKVVNSGEGCALMADIKNAENIITACVKATQKPVTVKFRKGFNENVQNAVDFAKMCEGAGASLITVHGRLSSQFYSGKSDRAVIGNVVKNVKIPVIANGDVFTREDADNLMDETGAAGIMVARGALGNPRIFSDILGKEYPLTMYDTVKTHFETLYGFTGEKFTALNMRKHLLWYLKFVKGGKALKPAASKCNTMEDLYKFAAEAFYGK